LKKSDFNFNLPERLIAQTPLEKRDASRLLVYDRQSGDISHQVFSDIIGYLNKGDALVVNQTKVIPARLFGTREGLKNPVEFLLLKRITATDWHVIMRPGKRLKPGALVVFSDELQAQVIEKLVDGVALVRFTFKGVFEEILDRLGLMPLPPYIKEKLTDKARYNTIYAKEDGSAAAPTAGLHFTKDLLKAIKAKGVSVLAVTLHVGLGTFRPVKEDELDNHVMHKESYTITTEVADKINAVKKGGGNIIAVGTTSVRTLESACDENGQVTAKSGDTDIFIYPGYEFKVVDKLITNFHLPESTLIMLISAMMGRQNALDAYAQAVEAQYRFFSFGDAMFIK
jgi:S-adenosylmethionine:tRNA ribosyltransferase-isomerase